MARNDVGRGHRDGGRTSAERPGAETHQHVPSQPAARAHAEGQENEDDEAGLGTAGRTALDGVPGIPAGDGQNLEHALETPDRELGGAVAADTTPGGRTKEAPDARQVQLEDRERNTL